MGRKRACKNCHRLFMPVRNGRQQFCSDRLCQNARKSTWRLKKHQRDPDYRWNQNEASKRWRKKNPQYWKAYRASHPLYEEANRLKQRERHMRLYKEPEREPDPPDSSPSYSNKASQFANRDALISKNPIEAGVYQLIPHPYEKVANSDALIVEIAVVARDWGQIEENCKHTTL